MASTRSVGREREARSFVRCGDTSASTTEVLPTVSAALIAPGGSYVVVNRHITPPRRREIGPLCRWYLD